ncbi:transcription repressor OFP7-like [Ipomoea triloba]|uniref:transcription repressor OFP7-like n=1 Tax=Ipomoea triloba TaxID=35885 RepID=UPI00125E91B4|nr:transcription repressor OFP7-like [Ipomoea triloba]
MGKGFRLEISKLISSFKSCRSKDPSSLPNNPVPLSHAHKPSIRAIPNDLRKERREFRWRKEEEWHVVAATTSHDNNKPTPRRKISNSSLYEETLAAPPAPEKRNRQTRKSKKVVKASSSSSSSSGYENRIDEASRTRRNSRKKCGVFRSSPASESEMPARLSVFKKLIPCSLEGKVKESFAMVKRSKDPYEDFKGSMVEMILEKQMFEKQDLEQLLQCFLSLNTRQYHGIIVEVFSEIWEALFCTNNNNNSSDENSEGSWMSSGNRRKRAVC